MERAVLIFDADCGFCRWSMDKIMKWDRRGSLRAVALQDPEADTLLPHMDPNERKASWHLVTPTGAILSGGRAAPPLFRLLPGGRPLAAVAATFPGLTERLYTWVADHRDQLGKRLGTAKCAVDPRTSAAGR